MPCCKSLFYLQTQHNTSSQGQWMGQSSSIRASGGDAHIGDFWVIPATVFPLPLKFRDCLGFGFLGSCSDTQFAYWPIMLDL